MGGANTTSLEPHRSGDTHTHTEAYFVCHISDIFVTQIHTYGGWVLHPPGVGVWQADPQFPEDLPAFPLLISDY